MRTNVRRPTAPEPEELHPVVAFLADADLLQYAEALLEAGFDDMDTLLEMDEADMMDLGMPRGHVIKMRRCLREFGGQEAVHAPTQATQLARPPRVPSQTLPTHNAAGAAPTGNQVCAVQKSWESVKALGADHVGGLLYKHLFEMAPEAMELFPREVRMRYQSWTMEEREDLSIDNDSAALSVLFGKVINAVGMCVSNMQNSDALVPKLRQLGMRHLNYRGVTEHHFPILQKALMITLRECLEDSFTSEVEFAWSMVYGFLSAIMVQGLKEATELAARAQQCAISVSEKHDNSSVVTSLGADTPFGRTISSATQSTI